MKNTVVTMALMACCLAILLSLNAAPAFAQTTGAQQVTPPSTLTPQPPAAPIEIKVLRELHGITLGMPRDKVKTALGKPGQANEQLDEFKLEGGDLLTVHYDPQSTVRVIQLYCTDAKRAPAWADVTGDAQIEEKPNGSKHARKIVSAENFWVTMFQSQSGAVTTITVSRSN
jgi:hypothetical protein